jgi:uncharacterized protein
MENGAKNKFGFLKTMTGYLAALAVGYGAAVGGLYFAQRSLIYYPDQTRPLAPDFGVPEMTAFDLTTEDGINLLTWYHPPASASAPVIVYFHGNAGHIGYRASKIRPYMDAGFGVLLLSWRGYSGNEGSPSEEGLYSDGRAALSFLETEGITPDRMVLYGESLGSAIAVELAHNQAESGTSVGAVVLEAPFTSLPEVATQHYPWLPVSWMMEDRFESLSKIGDVMSPVLVLHGELDNVVPVDQGWRMAEAAKKPKQGRFYAEAGHNDLYEFDAADSVISFIEKYASGQETETISP